MKDLISIIVPVYNVEDYLPECIESIINQTYKNIEIILVDDGSTDRSGIICDYYAKKDQRIIVIHKKNTGVANSRNIGIDIAKGDYIFFVDSDDMLDITVIDQMLKISYDYGADMVCAECFPIDEDGNIISCDGLQEKIYIMDSNEAMRYYAQRDWAPWNRLMKMSLHKNIKFPNYRIHEDEAIKFKLLDKCNTIAHLNKRTYYYRQREGSITDMPNGDLTRVDVFCSRIENLKWLEENHPDIGVLFIKNVCDAALYVLNIFIQNKRLYGFENIMDEIIKFSKKYFLKILVNKYCGLSYKLRFTLINLSNWNDLDCLYVRFYRLIGR